MTEKNINYSMKLFSAIAIIAVCSGHISATGLGGPFDMILPYSYQVAAFVFISGYFFSDSAEKTPGHYLAHKAKRLIVPLVLINAVYGIVVSVLHQLEFSEGANLSFNSLIIDPFTTGHQFTINLPMWFLAPLFFAEFINLFISILIGRISRGGGSKEIIIFFIYITIGAIAITLGGSEGLRTGWLLLLARTMFFLACFGMGRFYRRVLERHDTLRSLWYFLIILSLQLVVIWACNGAYTYIPSWCRFPHGVILTYATTILSLAFVLRICKILGPAIGKSKTILTLADNTFSIMCHHIFGYFLLTTFFAIMAFRTPFFQHFDFASYHNSFLYCFFPGNLGAFAFAYVVAGISFSIFVHFCWERLRGLSRKLSLGPCAAE